MTPPARPRRLGPGVPVPPEAEIRRRLALASAQLVTLPCELDDLTADLSWLQLTAAHPPDLGDA